MRDIVEDDRRETIIGKLPNRKGKEMNRVSSIVVGKLTLSLSMLTGLKFGS